MELNYNSSSHFTKLSPLSQIIGIYENVGLNPNKRSSSIKKKIFFFIKISFKIFMYDARFQIFLANISLFFPLMVRKSIRKPLFLMVISKHQYTGCHVTQAKQKGGLSLKVLVQLLHLISDLLS